MLGLYIVQSYLGWQRYTGIAGTEIDGFHATTCNLSFPSVESTVAVGRIAYMYMPMLCMRCGHYAAE